MVLVRVIYFLVWASVICVQRGFDLGHSVLPDCWASVHHTVGEIPFWGYWRRSKGKDVTMNFLLVLPIRSWWMQETPDLKHNSSSLGFWLKEGLSHYKQWGPSCILFMACSSPPPNLACSLFRFIAPTWGKESRKWLKSTASAPYLLIEFSPIFR